MRWGGSHFEAVMSFITIMCTKTGDFVSTGVEIDAKGFKRYPPIVQRIRCPSCHSEHVWSKGRAWLTDPSDRLVKGGHFSRDIITQIPMNARSPQEVRSLAKTIEGSAHPIEQPRSSKASGMREYLTKALLRF